MRITLLILILVVAIMMPQAAGACEMIVFPWVSRDPELTALAGIVRKHMQMEIPLDTPTQAPGFVVEVTDSTGAPPIGAMVAVFPLGTQLDCTPTPRSREDVKREYPLAEEITVVGTVVELSQPIVMSWAEDSGSVARRPSPTPRTDLGCLDFRQFKETYEDNPYDTYSEEVAWRNHHRMAYEGYEFFRCLALLEPTPERSVRDSEFLNVSYYSGYDRIRPEHALRSFEALLKNNDVPPGDRRRLIKVVRERWAG